MAPISRRRVLATAGAALAASSVAPARRRERAPEPVMKRASQTVGLPLVLQQDSPAGLLQGRRRAGPHGHRPDRRGGLADPEGARSRLLHGLAHGGRHPRRSQRPREPRQDRERPPADSPEGRRGRRAQPHRLLRKPQGAFRRGRHRELRRRPEPGQGGGGEERRHGLRGAAQQQGRPQGLSGRPHVVRGRGREAGGARRG